MFKGIEIQKEDPYAYDFMQEGKTTHDFIEDISYTIKLDSVKKIIDVCNYDHGLRATVILV